MLYPWWYVPQLTAPMLIAIIAVLHVIVSHYAVGGGILIALENQFALRTGDANYRDYWYRHTKFFVLLTVAYGAITGVGIWWTIGLTSPLATQSLIRIFVFGWAMEWVFFTVEVVSAFCIYYGWRSLPAKTHIAMAWIYAIAAWISLVLITGITAFMLNANGLVANWSDTGNFWAAFVNVQWLPQTLIRTGASLLLASAYVFTHAAFVLSHKSDLKARVIRRMSMPMLVGAITMGLGLVGWFTNLPASTLRLLVQAPVLVIFTSLLAAIAVLLIGVSIAILRSPRTVSTSLAVTVLLISFVGVTLGEFVREAARKPYIVDKVVLGNQIFPHQIPSLRQHGILESSEWMRKKLAMLDASDTVTRGQMVFMAHCNNCHAAESGFTAVGPLMTGLDRDDIIRKVKHLNAPMVAMPPWCGTDEEAAWLADYLLTIRPDWPNNSLQ
ncbi:MAG: cytochrome ubiquinol oxidase subunit I [Thermoguttaceae bacterium]